MSNKKIIREVFEQEINIDSMHDILLSKIKKREKQIYKRYAYVLIIFILGFAFIGTLYNKHIEYQKDKFQKINNIIYINDIIDDSAKYLERADVDGRVVIKEREEMIHLFPFVKNVRTPIQTIDVKMSEIYASNNPNSEFYNKLTGYHLGYLESDYENKESGKKISIFFSKTNKSRSRCTPILEEELKDSIIQNNPVKIGKYYDEYIVLFKKMDFYFDIETKNITEDKLIEMIVSILEENTYEK